MVFPLVQRICRYTELCVVDYYIEYVLHLIGFIFGTLLLCNIRPKYYSLLSVSFVSNSFTTLNIHSQAKGQLTELIFFIITLVRSGG